MTTTCPVCDRETYEEDPGESEHEPDGSGQQLTPNTGWCGYCGFFYQQSIHRTEAQQAADYKSDWLRGLVS